MQIVGYINTNKDYLHGQKMKFEHDRSSSGILLGIICELALKSNNDMDIVSCQAFGAV